MQWLLNNAWTLIFTVLLGGHLAMCALLVYVLSPIQTTGAQFALIGLLAFNAVAMWMLLKRFPNARRQDRWYRQLPDR